MPAVNFNVHQFTPNKLGTRKLTKTDPYRRFSSQGEPHIYVQGGRALYEGGEELKEFPGWFKMILEQEGPTKFTKVGGVPKPKGK